jgi:chromosome partitioning protein
MGSGLKTIAVVNLKGGVSKTTVVVCLAACASRAGYRAAIIDLDPQQSATAWRRRRSGAPPIVATCGGSELEENLDRLRANKYDFIFLDTAGALGNTERAALSAFHLALVPSANGWISKPRCRWHGPSSSPASPSITF